MPRKQLEPEFEQPPLNPHFENILPEMVEDFSQIIIGIKPHLESASVRTGQLLDHLRFEIDKAKLALDKLGWETKIDQAEKQRLEAWHEKLVTIRDAAESQDAQSSLTFIESLLVQVSENFTQA